ncbi:hypothetical protein EVAR_68131_1 [Eumeta japonica]|uniref:Uncharacterized protein n=1 Tax=Eumeta variegata TaxID=151549 RepID=A0A4C1T4A4_EUMVA|nr:hypothetical protein EVAR_68131_1 [Eumeta japonica]
MLTSETNGLTSSPRHKGSGLSLSTRNSLVNSCGVTSGPGKTGQATPSTAESPPFRVVHDSKSNSGFSCALVRSFVVVPAPRCRRWRLVWFSRLSRTRIIAAPTSRGGDSYTNNSRRQNTAKENEARKVDNIEEGIEKRRKQTECSKLRATPKRGKEALVSKGRVARESPAGVSITLAIK